MKVCFPVEKADGMGSLVYGHFGSAPIFMVVETSTGSVSAISNSDQHHAHGACNPLKALNNEKVDAVVVGGIGVGALTKLNQLGIKVFQAKGRTIEENMKLLQSNTLPGFTAQHCCSGHSHIGGCSH
ncbi:MAG TPA: NifB/NifX family molybdenum-iron cluster-binding protein [Thermodesulfovibrionales bacterium]|nr:NifB/NifX family molybdenum-iron cluster-binding protein [Thermodesulfovibrionales bacterium]